MATNIWPMLEVQSRASNWVSMCRQIESHASLYTRDFTAESRGLVLDRVRQFCAQPMPKDADEVNRRQMQRSGLSRIMSHVHHLEQMGGVSPETCQRVHQACSHELPNNLKEFGRLCAVLMGGNSRT